MSTEIIRVQNPRTLLIPGFAEFLVAALSTSPLIPDAEAAVLELVEFCQHPQLGLFVTYDDNGPIGMALAEHCTSAFCPGVNVLHFYNTGRAESRNLLIHGLKTFAADRGESKIRGFDINHRSEAFDRLFKAIGSQVELGRTVEYTVH